MITAFPLGLQPLQLLIVFPCSFASGTSWLSLGWLACRTTSMARLSCEVLRQCQQFRGTFRHRHGELLLCYRTRRTHV